MAGHSLALDALTKHNPKLLVTMEDYLWAKLSLVHSGTQAAPAPLLGGAGSSFLSGGGGGGVQPVAGGEGGGKLFSTRRRSAAQLLT